MTTTKVIKGGIIINEKVQVIIQISLIIIMESKDISRLNVLTLIKRGRRLVT